MRQAFHPAWFLGTVILLCTAWLSARTPEPVVERLARNTPRVAVVDPPSIALDTATLERYAGEYEGRGGFKVYLTLKDGKLFAQGAETLPTIPMELAAKSEAEFFVKGAGVDLEFDVATDGTVRGFSADTEFGLIEVQRVR